MKQGCEDSRSAARHASQMHCQEATTVPAESLEQLKVRVLLVRQCDGGVPVARCQLLDPLREQLLMWAGGSDAAHTA